jgi:hypothetical protein
MKIRILHVCMTNGNGQMYSKRWNRVIEADQLEPLRKRLEAKLCKKVDFGYKALGAILLIAMLSSCYPCRCGNPRPDTVKVKKERVSQPLQLGEKMQKQ